MAGFAFIFCGSKLAMVCSLGVVRLLGWRLGLFFAPRWLSLVGRNSDRSVSGEFLASRIAC